MELYEKNLLNAAATLAAATLAGAPDITLAAAKLAAALAAADAPDVGTIEVALAAAESALRSLHDFEGGLDDDLWQLRNQLEKALPANLAWGPDGWGGGQLVELNH